MLPMTYPTTLGMAIDTIVAHHKSHNDKEPPPTQGKVDVTTEVIKDLEERAEIGAKKYGTRLQSHNGRRGIVDAYQEALDLCVYLKQELIERYDNSFSEMKSEPVSLWSVTNCQSCDRQYTLMDSGAQKKHLFCCAACENGY